MSKKIKYLSLLALLLVAFGAIVSSKDALAAGKPKLSKSSLTFASPTAKAQTVTIKNLKTSSVKKITINNDWKEWLTIKKKGKNKLVITPKRSSGNLTYGISISIEYKKPVNGAYSDYLSFKKIRIKGSSKIAIKTVKDLCSMRGGYSAHHWTYYLANDIDMTGKGVVKYPGEYGSDRYTDLYLDGKGHTIKSDTPVFSFVEGTLKNINFNVNMKCKISANDAVSKIWSQTHYNGYGGIAPIVEIRGTMEKCTATGSINIDLDKELNYYGNNGDPNTKIAITEARVAGLVSENMNSSVLKQCKSDVDITVKFSDYSSFAYIGGLVSENYGYSGNSQFATISECMYSGNIKITKDTGASCYVGGLAGENQGFIKDSLFNGSISGEDSSAGITGWEKSPKSIERVLTLGSAHYGFNAFPVSEGSDLPKYKDSYYLKSKYDAFYYLGNAIAVAGIKAVEDADLTNQTFFTGLDFDKVWTMGSDGPTLKNLP